MVECSMVARAWKLVACWTMYAVVTTAAAPVNTPFPLPAKVSWGEGLVWLCGPERFSIKVVGACGTHNACPVLEAATERYIRTIFEEHTEPASPQGCLDIATVIVASDNSTLNLGTDESYELSVSAAQGARVTAKTIFGAMLGLESLSQLVRFDASASRAFFIGAAPWAITDMPRFQHRELLVDSSRHFLPLRVIKNVIASLPAAKINVLHWHLTDDQSFPFCSRALPKLCTSGSFSFDERYTVEDLKDVVAFARMYGVNVMVEIDVPGHTRGICMGYPEACEQSGNMLTPGRAAFETMLSALLGELRGIFPYGLLHLGGDEVDFGRYEKDPDTLSWLKARNLTGGKDAYKAAIDFVHKEALRLGWLPVGWSEIFFYFGKLLDPRSIVDHWRDEDSMTDPAAAGYKLLYSGYSKWYLDLEQTTWDKAYKGDPCEELSDTLCNLVLGGGGELWGERVDASDILNTAWPRLGAIGERLWSPRGSTQDVAAALPRLKQLRCLLNRRGIQAAPVTNPVAREPPAHPDGCEAQTPATTQKPATTQLLGYPVQSLLSPLAAALLLYVGLAPCCRFPLPRRRKISASLVKCQAPGLDLQTFPALLSST